MDDDCTTTDGLTLGEYRIHTAWEGFASIVHGPSGEIMHSRTEPMVEAERVYVQQAGLADRLRLPAELGPLVLWDVGLGAGANAVAAIRCQAELAAAGVAVRGLQIVSFENDLNSLRLAVGHPERFGYLRHPGPEVLLAGGVWGQEEPVAVRWEVVLGDFAETVCSAGAAPEVIFYDMFSPKTCPEAWRGETFRRLAKRCEGRRTVLCTYTLSTAARATMLAAGFWVARGRCAGAKEETTVALTELEAREPWTERPRLLGAEWLAKWERSKAQFPGDLGEEERGEFAARIRGHGQFCFRG